MYRMVLSFQGIPIIAGCSAVMQCLVHSVHTVNTHHCSFFPGYPYNSWLFCSNAVSCTLAIIGIPWKERTMVGINCMYRMYTTLYYCRTSSYYRNTLERKNNGGSVNTHHCSFFPGYPYNSWLFCSNAVSCTFCTHS
jgi:hypothetical protein